jgi:Ca2+-binding RTX toxin-like protein
VGGPVFQPGPALQVDQAGSPTISNIEVEDYSADTAIVRFTTNEPTTATAVTGATTYIDNYNEGPDGFPGLDEATVETSAEYADKPVVGTQHEIMLTGLSPGASASIQVKAKDLANNEVSQTITHATPGTIFQADADDIGQLSDGTAGGWRTGTQLYAGRAPEAILGAFMFRLPSSFDPATITGAAVELTSTHNWMVPYTQDPLLYVDLLGPSVEASWGTQDYAAIHSAPMDARLNPETTHKVGDYQTYSFGLGCTDLAKLKATLSTLTAGSRAAAFRWESTDLPGAGLFAMEFGFNRRSRGPENRPRLVLFTEQTESNPFGAPCDPNAPAPTISDIGIHAGSAATTATVSWNTDVPSDSFVLFREKGTTAWLQVGTLERTMVHHVQVKGLDPAKEHEFVVRSASCNGATTTDTNGGAGYDFDYPPITRQTYWFAGLTEDEANKQAGPPFPAGSLTWDQTAPTTAQEDIQKANFFASEDYAGNPIAAFWMAPWSGPIDQDVTLDWWWSLPNATPVLGQDLIISVFADADPATGDGTLIARSQVGVTLGQDPVRNIHTIHIEGTPTQNLLIQAQPYYTVSGEDVLAHYDGTATPSNWSWVTGGGGPAGLPVTGPLPPPSAGASGLNPPATRPGPATAAEIAAGTVACDIVVPNQPPTADATATPTNAKVNQTVSFSGAGSTDDRDPAASLTYQWDFTTDGTWDATSMSVQHAYPAVGTYTVTLRVTDTDGASGTDTVVVTVTQTTTVKCPGYETKAGNHVVGTAGNDTLTGTAGVDIICGLGGNDTIDGLGANDILIGGLGDDTIAGGLGDDRLEGGDARDTLNGGDGDDQLFGGAGNDVLNGGNGNDVSKGGDHDDTFDGGPGNDRMYGERGNDVLTGGLGNDVLHTKDRVKGNDSGDGGAGTDTCKKDANDAIVNCEN